jgi:hypothetical protein
MKTNQNLVVTPSSVEITVRRGTILRNTFPIVHTRRHVRLYSVYCSVRQKFLTVFNLILGLRQTMARQIYWYFEMKR